MENTKKRSFYCDSQMVEFIKKRGWEHNKQTGRKMYLFQLAQKSKESSDFAEKIGGFLIYNQLIEQYLVDIIQICIYYIKAKIWPDTIELDVEADKATFGKMIEYFRQYATVEPNREKILSYLKKFNIKRNQVVHDLFDVEDLENLYWELSKYAQLADEIIGLLDAYHCAICENFCQLEHSGILSQLT